MIEMEKREGRGSWREKKGGKGQNCRIDALVSECRSRRPSARREGEKKEKKLGGEKRERRKNGNRRVEKLLDVEELIDDGRPGEKEEENFWGGGRGKRRSFASALHENSRSPRSRGERKQKGKKGQANALAAEQLKRGGKAQRGKKRGEQPDRGT